VLRCEGEYWTLAFGGIVIRLRDTKGLRHLALLLRDPCKRIPARDLFLAANGRPSGAARLAVDADDAQHSDRYRLAVTKNIMAALKRIEAHHSSLGYHLRTTIKTGSECAYIPGQDMTIEWQL
jgi:hypothetical protein